MNIAVVELEDTARDSVTAYATPEAKRVIPDVITGVEKGPQSIGGSSPSRDTISTAQRIESAENAERGFEFHPRLNTLRGAIFEVSEGDVVPRSTQTGVSFGRVRSNSPAVIRTAKATETTLKVGLPKFGAEAPLLNHTAPCVSVVAGPLTSIHFRARRVCCRRKSTARNSYRTPHVSTSCSFNLGANNDERVGALVISVRCSGGAPIGLVSTKSTVTNTLWAVRRKAFDDGVRSGVVN